MDYSKRQPSSEEIFRRELSVTMAAQTAKKKSRPSVSEHSQRLTAFGVSLSTTLSDVILVYPCVVLRRQCQVSNMGRKYHFTPFTIISVAWKMQRVQGFTCLWKGIGSNLLVSAMNFGVENAISEASDKFPKEVNTHSKLKEVAGHVLLKVFSISLTLPFYSAHLVESIQSEAASETPGILYCITEGFSRLFGFAGVQSRRLLPFRYLLLPTVLHLLLRYVLTNLLQYAIMSGFRLREKWHHDAILRARGPPAVPNVDYMSVPSTSAARVEPLTLQIDSTFSHTDTQQRELWASFFSSLAVDVALYPFECVINRLHVQGTRTIIDDMDRGSGFLPVSSRYEGFLDCFSTIKSQEGARGLYKGFGALILQHVLKISVVKVISLALSISGSPATSR